MTDKIKKKRRRKRIIIAILLIVVVLVLLRVTGVWGQKKGTLVETDKVQLKTIVESVSASGKLQPATEVKISADVSGEITELPVKEGMQVNKGDLLLKIRPDNYLAAVQRAEASLNNAKATLENSKAQVTQSQAQFSVSEKNYERNKKLRDKQAISTAEFDRVESEYLVAKAQLDAAKQSMNAARYNVESARANLKDAQDNLAKTTIFFFFSGTISKLNAEKGERVVGTMQMQGTEILTIADLNIMEVEVEVNENDIIRIEKLDTAIIEIDAFYEEEFKGIVTQIANSAKSSQEGMTDQATNFAVTVRILESSYRHLIDTSKTVSTPFRPGMSAIVEILTDQKKDVKAIPILSVTTREDEEGNDDQEVVFLLDGSQVKMKEISTGIQDDYYIELINSDMDTGTVVISGPYSAVSKTLKEGMDVRTGSKEEK